MPLAIVLLILNLIIAFGVAFLVDLSYAHGYLLTTGIGATLLGVQAIIEFVLALALGYAIRDEFFR